MKIEKLLNRNYIVMLIVVIITNMGFNMLSAIITPYAVSMGYALTLAGFAAGVMSIVAMLSRPFSGIVSDRFNQRKTMIVFTLLSALTIFGYASTTSMTILIALRVAHGLLFGITTTITMAVTGECIPNSRLGEGMGYYGVAQAVATAVGPNLGLSLSSAIGYTTAFMIAGGFTLLAAATILMLKLPPKEHAVQQIDFSYLKKNLIAKEAMPFFLISFGIGSIGGLENSFLALYGMEHGLMNVGWYFTISAITLIVVKFGLGRAVDKYRFPVILLLGSAFEVVALVLLASLNAGNAAVVLASAAISRSIGIGLLQPAIQALCFKSVPIERRGAASGTYFLQMDIGVGSAPIIGAGLQGRYSYSGMFMLYTLPILFSIFLYFAWERKRKKVRTA